MGCAALTLLDRLGNVLEVVLFALVVRRDGRRCPGLAIGAKLRININIYELVSPDGNVFALLLSYIAYGHYKKRELIMEWYAKVSCRPQIKTGRETDVG